MSLNWISRYTFPTSPHSCVVFIFNSVIYFGRTIHALFFSFFFGFNTNKSIMHSSDLLLITNYWWNNGSVKLARTCQTYMYI